MVNVKLQNTVPNARNRSAVVNVKISQGPIQKSTSVINSMFGGPGYLIGMLGMTYTKAQIYSSTVITTGGLGVGPNVRIVSN